MIKWSSIHWVSIPLPLFLSSSIGSVRKINQSVVGLQMKLKNVFRIEEEDCFYLLMINWWTEFWRNKKMIIILGAGQEVGRSCIILEYKGKTIMVNRIRFSRQSRSYFSCETKSKSSSRLFSSIAVYTWAELDMHHSRISIRSSQIRSTLFSLHSMTFLSLRSLVRSLYLYAYLPTHKPTFISFKKNHFPTFLTSTEIINIHTHRRIPLGRLELGGQINSSTYLDKGEVITCTHSLTHSFNMEQRIR